jgi:exopolysaccharide production protein ExoZ
MIKNLQYLRAFAATNVAYLHVLIGSEMYDMSASSLSSLSTSRWGASGVDIFFVISGFIMMYTQIHNPKKIHEFYFSRINRIVPIYWLISLFIIILYLIIPIIFKNFTLDLKDTLDLKRMISSFFFMAQPFTGGKPVIVIGWSLEWEMLFYFIFGLSLFLQDIKKRIYLIFLLMVIIFVLTKYLLIFEFFLGVLIAYIQNKVKLSHNVGLIIFILGIILLLLSLNSYFYTIDIDRFFKWGIPSVFIIAGAIYCRQLDNSLLFYLGNASYSIYLINVITIPFFYKFIIFFNIKMNNELLTILCLFFTLIVGCFFHSFIEKNLKIKKN